MLRIRELSYDTQVGRCFFVRGDNSAQGRTGMESQFNGPLHVRAVLSTVSRDRERACNVEAGAHELDVSRVVQLALCALRGCDRGFLEAATLGSLHSCTLSLSVIFSAK